MTITNEVYESRKAKDDLFDSMYKWKYDTITDSELDAFHQKVEGYIHFLINKFNCDNKDDTFNEVWQHLTMVKSKWDENSKNKVCTWMYYVVSNWIKTVKYYDNRRNNRFVSFTDYAPDDHDMEEIALSRLSVNKDTKSEAICQAVRDWESKLTGAKKQYVQLLIEPDSDVLSLVNSRKKYYSDKISKSDMARIMRVPVTHLETIRSELATELRGFLNDRTELLFHKWELPVPL